MAIRKVLIVGSGLMGGGIAQVCAQAGIEVYMNDVAKDILDRTIKNIASSVGKLVEKGKISGKVETVMSRIHPETDFASAAQVDLAVEAVFEKLDLKQGIFKELDERCGAETLLK